MVGPCYGCGDMGNLRKTCTKVVHSQERWYPGDMVAVDMTKVDMTKGSVEFCE